ncbi:hypothetical protein [Streptomyces sp. RKAG293]|uniref:effector-associated constant component EACC1 n=1 Tax=Streptomyces sp. RKAG293 TaxID=2893403 RepID=UPI00203425A0|nr:hypothetical protein [Streptomyces sp. RKAG293]MCM2422115.1 hypothetical protein [Streptomyces sp. RKAG293]
MEARISVDSGSAVADLESLDGWLRGEPGLAGRVRAEGGEPAPTELGSLPDVLTVALGAGGSVTVLAASLRAWISQPRRSDVKLTISQEGGRSVEIDAKRVKGEDLGALLQQVLDADGPV